MFSADAQTGDDQQTRDVHENEPQKSEPNEGPLTEQELRFLLRRQRTAMIPEALGARIRGRLPDMHGPDAPVIAHILHDLTIRARKELDEAGIVPSGGGSGEPQQKLTSQERHHVSDMAALLIWYTESLIVGFPALQNEEFVREISIIPVTRETLAWAELGGEIRQICICRIVLAIRVAHEGDFEEANRIYATTIDELTDYIEQHELLEQEEEYRSQLIELHLFHARTLVRKGEWQRGIEQVEKGQGLIRSGDMKKTRAKRVALEMARLSAHRGAQNYSDALAAGERALRWSDPEFDPQIHAALLQQVATLYSFLEDSERSLKLLLEAMATIEANGLSIYGVHVYLDIATHYAKQDEIDRAEEIMDRIEAILELDGKPLSEQAGQHELDIRATRADLLRYRGQHDEAGELLDWVIEKSIHINYHTTVVAACAIAAISARAQKNYDRASNLLRIGIDHSHSSSLRNQLRLKLDLAQAEFDRGNAEEASNIISAIEQDITEESRQYLQYLDLQSRICEAGGDLEGALQYERESRAAEQTIVAKEREHSLRSARIIAETNMFEQAVRFERDRLSRLEHEFAQVSVRNSELEKLLQETADQLRQQLSKGENDQTNGNRSDRDLRRMIAQLEQHRTQTESPLAYLRGDAREFIARLRSAHPALTSKQERLAVLIRSGLSSREICALMEIGAEGLKSHRKRLRKALDVKQGESLETIIAGI